MKPSDTRPLLRLIDLVFGVFRAPVGAFRISLAFFYGLVCHLTFEAAVLAMIVTMFFGMSESFGRVPSPWSILANLACPAIPNSPFAITVAAWRNILGQTGTARFWANAHYDNLCNHRFSTTAGLVCSMDTKRNCLVASRRGSFCHHLLLLYRVLVAVDLGQL